MITTVFVIDTPNCVIMLKRFDPSWKYPVYRFDNDYAGARDACEYIANIQCKPIINAIMNENHPVVYKPAEPEIVKAQIDYMTKLRGIIA